MNLPGWALMGLPAVLACAAAVLGAAGGHARMKVTRDVG